MHFAMSAFLWILQLFVGLKIGGLDWAYLFQHATPAFLLFALFLAAFILACRSRILAVPVLVVSLVTAASIFFYDTSHHYYQIQSNDGTGCRHLYVTWFWYDDSHDPKR